MQLLSRGVTRFHDWYDKRRTIPHRMVEQARQAGLIGSVDWISVGPKDERQTVKNYTLDKLIDHRPLRGELYRIAAGGSEPSPWEMRLALFPFDKSLNQVKGFNILSLWFEAEPWFGPERSDALTKLFRTIHTADNTEVGFIHPYERWSELTDTLRGPYGEPVTAAPLFTGIFWVNFLGAGHLSLFKLEQLRDLQTYQVEWENEQGLFIRVCQDVAESTSPAIEEEMFRLTNNFKSALK